MWYIKDNERMFSTQTKEYLATMMYFINDVELHCRNYSTDYYKIDKVIENKTFVVNNTAKIANRTVTFSISLSEDEAKKERKRLYTIMTKWDHLVFNIHQCTEAMVDFRDAVLHAFHFSVLNEITTENRNIVKDKIHILKKYFNLIFKAMNRLLGGYSKKDKEFNDILKIKEYMEEYFRRLELFIKHVFSINKSF